MLRRMLAVRCVVKWECALILLPALKHPAAYNLMNQSAQRVICGFVTVQNCFHFLPVSELDFSPSGKRDQQ